MTTLVAIALAFVHHVAVAVPATLGVELAVVSPAPFVKVPDRGIRRLRYKICLNFDNFINFLGLKWILEQWTQVANLVLS